MNRETAITQAGLNMVNQNTPTGSLSYRQAGRWPDGTPRFESTTNLTPDQQRLLDQQEQFGHLFGETALNQGRAVQDTLSTPFKLDNEATEGRLMELGRRRLDPMWDERRQGQEADLAARGVMPGSEAYDRAMRNFGQSRNDAYTQLLLQGRGQAANELLTERNQPLNEITAMMSGNQVQQPNFVNTPQTGVAGTDLAGLVNANYQQRLAGWQQNQANSNALFGNLGNLAGTAAGMWFMSDERIKDDFGTVGQTDDGIPVHAFRYKGDPGGLMHIGFMAQEVAKKKPDAVRRGPGGLMQVAYDRAAA